MFKQPCLLRKNTPQIRKILENLGYELSQKRINEWLIPIEDFKYLRTETYGEYSGTNEYNITHHIDCKQNVTLFLAIAALRDDTYEAQFFTDGEKWVIFKPKQEKINTGKYHKATIEELIKKFKDY